jgi:Ca2+-binding RTX toxin-like protein
VAPTCETGEGTGNSWALCTGGSGSLAVKLGDLDHKASVDLPGALTMDGGSGDDSLNSGNSSATLTGGTGRDVLITGSGNDTINARSANWIDPDIDASITCGAGDDTVIADRQDPISAGQNGCEHVSKP